MTTTMRTRRWIIAAFTAGGITRFNLAAAAELTSKQITEALFRNGRGAAALDFQGKDLSALDLAGLDFKGARLDHANLYGSDLANASLKGARLEGARLDRAILTRTDFSDANLKNASMLSINVHAALEPIPADAPNFRGADLSGARIAARLDGADFRGANLSDAHIGRLVATWGSWKPRAVFNGADFSGATLRHTDLSEAVLQFTRFVGADLSDADLRNCDFTKADLTGANLAGADIKGADFDEAVLKNISGLETAVGLSGAKNFDKAIR